MFETVLAVQDTLDIMNYVSKHYSVKKILTKGTKVTSLDVAVAKDNQKIKIKNLNDTTAFLPNDFNKKDLKYKYSYKKLEAPVKKGAKVGKLKVYYKNNLVYQEEYVATKEIERDKFQDVLNEIMNFIFPYGLAIVLVLIYFIIDKKKKRR